MPLIINKITAVLLAVLLALAFVGCNKNEKPDDNTPANNSFNVADGDDTKDPENI